MKVYLSSTLNDLHQERQEVKDALGGECVVVESYTADERSVRDSCLADVATCDLYIGIVGLRYGFIPPGQKLSITEQEYREARRLRIPILAFIKDADQIKSTFSDAYSNENPRELIEAFRKELSSGAIEASRAPPFKSPKDLKADVLKAYLRYSRRHEQPRPKPIEGRPYPGLRAFLPTEADRFFGRDGEVESLLERLLVRDLRFLCLIGASGSGKSSLVYAGLIPKLTASPIVDGAHWVPVSFSPRQFGDDPFLALAAALVAKSPSAGWRATELAQRLRLQPSDIAAVAQEALGADGKSDAKTRLLLFGDQFEEVFAAKVDTEARAAFFAMLNAAIECPLMRVVITMRSEFYTQWPQDEASVVLLRDGHFPVAAPGPAALEKMIADPARVAGLRFDPKDLVQRILQDTGTAPGALALAEFALSQLFDRRQDDTLTESAYEAIGGVAGAVEGLAENAVKDAERALKEQGKALTEEDWTRLFLAISSVEEREQDTAIVRRRATIGDLKGTVAILAKHLVDKRLLVSSGGTDGQPKIVEVGHEAVFSHWSRFKNWYASHADDLALEREAKRAAAGWHEAKRPTVLRWVWERQKPALEALRKLNHLASASRDSEFADPSLALWQTLATRLQEPLMASFLRPEPLLLLEELRYDETSEGRRKEIGLRLAEMGDPRRGVGVGADGLPDLEWLDVPGGEIALGDEFGSAQFEPFQISRYPVTRAQYHAFLVAKDGFGQRAWWQSRVEDAAPAGTQRASSEASDAFSNCPAFNVSGCNSRAFTSWLTSRLGCEVRLLTLPEWIWAAQDHSDVASPGLDVWKADDRPSHALRFDQITAVGMSPMQRNSFGVDDMTGSSWEMCLEPVNGPKLDERNLDVGPLVLRVGPWVSMPRIDCRILGLPAGRLDRIAFRVCRSLQVKV